MMCTIVLHGGVCHRTSTPHKSGIKMKEKKKKLLGDCIQSVGRLTSFDVYSPTGRTVLSNNCLNPR